MSLKDILMTSKKSSDEGISLTEEDTDGEDADTLYKASKHESKEYYKINAGEFNEQSSPTAPHALRPPSHLLKARRVSKHNSLPVDKHALQRTHQRQDSTNSAVSPRFMAMRKLSEVSPLPPNTLSSPMENPRDKEFQTKLALNIDEIIDTQLQLHLGQLVWRASESHLEARRFWEEQKKEMFGFAAELIDRLDHHPPPPQCVADEDQQKWREMENELQKYKLKSAQKQSQLFEMDVLKTRHAELEKEHQDALVQLNQVENQRMDKVKLEERIKDLEEQLIHYSVLTEYHSDDVKVDDLMALNKQLKNQLDSVEQINRQLHDQMVEYESALANQSATMQEMAQRNKDLEIELTQYKLQASSPPITKLPIPPQQGFDCGEDFGTKKIPTVNWADMMNSEDEAKKWSSKYKSLEKEYNHLCQRLKQTEVKDEKKQLDLLQALNSKEDEIKRLKQAGRVSHIQLNHLQQELNKQPKKKKQEEEETKDKKKQQEEFVTKDKKKQQEEFVTKDKKKQQEEFATKDGYLTFTTEINGRPSTYSIKIPNNQQKRLNPNAPAWRH